MELKVKRIAQSHFKNIIGKLHRNRAISSGGIRFHKSDHFWRDNNILQIHDLAAEVIGDKAHKVDFADHTEVGNDFEQAFA